MYYILFYKTVENYIERRAPYREEHLNLAMEAHQKGSLMLGGALGNPADGAILVFKGDSPEVAEDFVKRDPYVRNGLITEWTIREWNVVIGGN